METENIVYKTCPSQVRNIGVFTLCMIVMAAIIAAAIYFNELLVYLGLFLPLIYGFWKWLEIRNTKLQITDQRLIVTEGILNRTTNETELYRVRDTTIKEPFFYRIFGLGNIIVFTTDEASATHTFLGYKKPHWVKDQIRNFSEQCRQKKRWGIDNVIQEHDRET